MTLEVKPWNELSRKEINDIFSLRSEVFIVEQNCPYPDLDDKDQEAHHMWIEDTGEIVCYLRINPAGSRFAEPSLGRIVTKRSHRKQGLAEVLINKAINLVCEKESRAIRISAQCYLEKYYEKFGFLKASEEYLEDDIPHIEMLRDV